MAVNGIPFCLGKDKAQGLANYPHARVLTNTPGHSTIYVSGLSSRRGDGSYEGVTENQDGTLTVDIREQTAAVLRNIDMVIKGATDGKGSIENVVDATVFLRDLEGGYAVMNEEWNKVWPDRATAPTRTTIGVSELPNKKIVVEIKCLAVI
ncbi:probable L-PSP endoribonuclease family protein [Fusarium torulosum]|uniref:Probable L-PSP endoribonuclease family protein n=1 Tax=Fusarium torulosum TaxID=33205 RepID=A0AAE8SMU5_9HYPO|nr:probable L-PSP endoribonuclease family protein [Fusarium torulosum]